MAKLLQDAHVVADASQGRRRHYAIFAVLLARVLVDVVMKAMAGIGGTLLTSRRSPPIRKAGEYTASSN